MTYQETTDDRLLANLLEKGQADTPEIDTESTEDLFELYIEGRLPEADREEFFRYLDANPAAREAASLYMMSLESEAEAVEAEKRATPSTIAASRWNTTTIRTMTFAAMAACLLLAFGIALRPTAGPQLALSKAAELLQNGEFEAAEAILDQLDADSTEAQVLVARAAAHEPAGLDEAGPWSLLSYGYELGDAVAMDGAPPEEQQQRLRKASEAVEAIDSTEADAELARAWIALKTNRADAAIESLDRVLAADDANAAAHLARGVASFMLGDFADAEARFRRHLELSPGSFAGQLNLGKALAEQGKYAEATEVFQAIDPATAPTDGIRKQLADEIRALEALVAEQQASEQ
ncbi:MAG: tetratricopeptide repeat protein [Planctomycetota bacterium]